MIRRGKTVRWEKNPFLPYSIILEKEKLKKLAANDRDIYTNFPILIIVRNDLEEVLADEKYSLLQMDKISFFVML